MDLKGAQGEGCGYRACQVACEVPQEAQEHPPVDHDVRCHATSCLQPNFFVSATMRCHVTSCLRSLNVRCHTACCLPPEYWCQPLSRLKNHDWALRQ